MIDNNSYIHIGWRMINDLKLKWNELYVYAIIYSFTNNTKDHYFGWSLSYLAEWTNQTIRNAQRCLKKLLDKGYITRKEAYDNWVKIVKYQNVHTIDKMSIGGMDKMSWNYGQNVVEGMDKMSTNNTSIYNTNKIQDRGDIENQDELEWVIQEFVKFRKSIKKPITDYWLKLLRNKLNKFYPWDTKLQIACVNNAIEHWWQSVYELKEDELKLYQKKKKTIELRFT